MSIRKPVQISALLLALCASGTTYAQSLEVARTKLKNKDNAGAIKELQPLANRGNADAQFLLGRIYQNGDARNSAIKDDKKAIEWYSKAAQQGHADAKLDLFTIYVNMIKGPDYKQAEAWFLKTAQEGDPRAQVHLGRLYEAGRHSSNRHSSREENHAQALAWYTKAAQQGYAEAQYLLGDAYASGMEDLHTSKKYIQVDTAQAKKWYQKAAAQGHSGAKSALSNWEKKAKLEKEKQEGKKKKEEFEKLRSKAGYDPDAAFEVANIFYYGKLGFKKNMENAMGFYGEAAWRGHADAKRILLEEAKKGDAYAQYSLGYLYRRNKEKDKAIDMFKKAAAQGHNGAKAALKNIEKEK